LTFFIFIFSSLARAADVQLQLDSSDGSSGFTIQNSSGVGKDRTDSNGNVGIGTSTSPNQALTILGGNVGIGTFAGQAAFVVTNGNVGIGTWAPVQPLHVNGHCVTGDTLLSVIRPVFDDLQRPCISGFRILCLVIWSCH